MENMGQIDKTRAIVTECDLKIEIHLFCHLRIGAENLVI